MPINVPNVLTLLRLLAIPLLVLVYWWPMAWLPEPDADPAWAHLRNVVACGVFVAAAVTDWVDGWLARKLGQTSAFGAFLDPVADKLIVSAALVMLIELDRVDALVAVVIIGREITISALREWMASVGARAHVAVHSLGKFKTAAQMAAIPMLLWHDPVVVGGVALDPQRAGTWLIVVAAALTLWSMIYYLRRALPVLRNGGAGTPPAKPAPTPSR